MTNTFPTRRSSDLINIDEIGATENRSFLNLPVTSGMQTLVINGTSGGSGSYSGTLAFAVPEPASWAMMIAGFGLLGGAIRVRKRQVKVSFADRKSTRLNSSP